MVLNTAKTRENNELFIRRDGVEYFANFPNLTDLIFIDFLYCNISASENELTVPYSIGNDYFFNDNYHKPSVELRKSERKFCLEDFVPKVIMIPEYVKVIESGVFSGLTGVMIKTSFQAKPEGWQDGWNGTCTIEWGAEPDSF